MRRFGRIKWGSLNPGKVAVYATDSLGSNSHVWVKITKITADANSGSQTLFEDAAGRVVDLASLRDGSGRKFAFLSLTKLSAQAYKSATVTMFKDLTLVPTGSQTGIVKQFADQFDDTTGKTKVTFGFKNSRNLGSRDPVLVIDFDLAKWNEVAGKVVPVLSESDDSGIDNHDRHNDEDQHGTVSNLTGVAPNYVFNLNLERSQVFVVHTDSSTVIFNSSKATNPTLTNGKRIEVRGKFISGQGFFLASSIKIEDSDDHDSAELKGTTGNVVESAGTFDVTVVRADRFVPGGSLVHVVTSDATVFRSHSGVTMTKVDFFAAIATATLVEVEGTFDSGTNTLTAARCKLEDDHDGGGGGGGGDGSHEAEAKGSTSQLDASAGTFSLSLAEWEGFSSTLGKVIQVTTSTQTVFKSKQGDVVSKEIFFAQVAITGKSEIKGTYQNGVLSAIRCKVED